MFQSKHFLLIPIAILVTITGILLIQNVNLAQKLQTANEDKQILEETVDNYTDVFGKVQFEEKENHYPGINILRTKGFIAAALEELEPVVDEAGGVLEVGKPYSATATVSRPVGVADYPPCVLCPVYSNCKQQR